MTGDGSDCGEVALAGGLPASVHLHRTLQAVADAHPGVFADVDVGESSQVFRKMYPTVLPEFEAARASSSLRCQLAAELVEAARSAIVWAHRGSEMSLPDLVAGSAEPLPIETRALGGTGNLRPYVVRDGARLEHDELTAYAHGLFDAGLASSAVADGTEWVVEHAATTGVDLRDRRIVVLGAGAELAPTRLLLAGGARLLWIDLSDPASDLVESNTLSGALSWVPGGADLLRHPHRIRATIEAFADGEAADLCLYAYAPGRTREWRLTAAMTAIVDALDSDVVKTITMLVSATTCGVLTAAELEGESRRRRERPRWQAALDRAGLLGRGMGHTSHGDTHVNRGIVPIQGASYQAAQYLGKLMAAEAWATAEPPRHVSANTAGISRTASVSHPVFDTAFGGARAFGVETYDPATTSSLNGLLTLRDWLDPKAPCQPESYHASPQDRARALTTTRVHGGIYEFPYPIDTALRVATAIGVAKDPRRIGPLLRRS